MQQGASPFHPIPYDVVLHQIVPHLNAQDLGRLMCVNHAFLSYFIRDETWNHVRDRCCDMVPFWREHVFDQLPWSLSRSQKKRAKLGKTRGQRISLPRSGVWYALRTFVSPCFHASRMIKLVRKHKRAIFHIDRDGTCQKIGPPMSVMVAAVVAGAVIGLSRSMLLWRRVDGVIDRSEFHGGLFDRQGQKVDWINFVGPAAYERSHRDFDNRFPRTVERFRPMFWFE